MCALKKATESKSEHSSVCQHSERGLQTFVLLLCSVSLSPVITSGLVCASGKLPEHQKRTVWAIHDKFLSQFSDLVSSSDPCRGSQWILQKQMRLTRYLVRQYLFLIARIGQVLAASHNYLAVSCNSGTRGKLDVLIKHWMKNNGLLAIYSALPLESIDFRATCILLCHSVWVTNSSLNVHGAFQFALDEGKYGQVP